MLYIHLSENPSTARCGTSKFTYSSSPLTFRKLRLKEIMYLPKITQQLNGSHVSLTPKPAFSSLYHVTFQNAKVKKNMESHLCICQALSPPGR